MGMDKAAIDRDDRQTFLALVMASGLPAIGQLKKLQQARGAKPTIDTSRTDSVPEAFTYLKPSREPCLIPFSKKLTLTELVESAKYCINMLHFCRNYVHSAQGLTLTDSSSPGRRTRR